MSRCGRALQLEAMVLGEITGAPAVELELHATHCAACQHELNWLRSERLMFEQRLARETVQQLWTGFAQKTARLEPVRVAPPTPASSNRWALALAASVLLLIGLSGRSRSPVSPEGSTFESAAPMSLEEMSRDVTGNGRGCSELQPGTGFACGPFLPASFALRE